MKICPKCNAQNANNAPVCKSCGSNLNEAVVTDKLAEYDDSRPYHILPAFLLSLAAVIIGGLKLLLSLNPEQDGYKLSNYYLYFIAVGLSLVMTIVAAILLRGLLKKRPVPMAGILTLMLVIASFAILVFDIATLKGYIDDFNHLSKVGLFPLLKGF